MTEKTIGILGGMGPEATLDCFGKTMGNHMWMGRHQKQ